MHATCRRPALIVVVALLATLLTACGEETAPGPTGRGTPPAPTASATLGVHSTLDTSKGTYIEGALADFRLRDDQGHDVEPARTDSDSSRWTDLAYGDYTLRAGLRPCDGNCGSLDGLTDICSRDVHVDADVVVDVVLTPTRSCRFE